MGSRVGEGGLQYQAGGNKPVYYRPREVNAIKEGVGDEDAGEKGDAA